MTLQCSHISESRHFPASLLPSILTTGLAVEHQISGKLFFFQLSLKRWKKVRGRNTGKRLQLQRRLAVMLRQAAALSGPGRIFTFLEGKVKRRMFLQDSDVSHWASHQQEDCHCLTKHSQTGSLWMESFFPVTLHVSSLKRRQLFWTISPDKQWEMVHLAYHFISNNAFTNSVWTDWLLRSSF